MKRFLSVLLAALMVCALAFAAAGCSSAPANDNGDDTATEPAGDTPAMGSVETAGNITTLVPDGWTLIPGNAGGVEDDNSLFLMSGEDYRSPYIWVTINTQANIDSSIKYNTSDEIAPFTVNGVEWQGKDKAFYAPIGDVIFFVMLNELSHDDATVQAVLESLNGRAE